VAAFSVRAMQIELSNLSKSYGTAPVLRDVKLTLQGGQVHALMGENGAGKSTLIRVLAGVTPADSIDLTIDGRAVNLRSAADAADLGLRFVHQELNIVPQLTVAENIGLSRPTPTRLGLIDWGKLNTRATAALARFGATHIDPRAQAGSLGTGDRILIVLAGLLADETPARVLVMDEPTAALTHAEADRLFAVIAELKAQGAAVLYVSHRMEEVMQIADRVTVLRDGLVAMTTPTGTTTKEAVIHAMTGRTLTHVYPPRRGTIHSGNVLEVDELSAGPLHGISFSLRHGETLGIAGLENAGQSALLQAILGAVPRRGAVRLAGNLAPAIPASAWAAGMAYVPRERRREGLMLGRGITPNITLPHLAAHAWHGIFSSAKAERDTATRLGAQVALKYDRVDQNVATLSGGNQQKIVFARAIASDPRLVLLDEPTRGVDVGARADIYALIAGLGAKGAGVLMTSSDLPELIGLCDRIAVLRDGTIGCIIPTDDLTPARLLSLIYGDTTIKDAS